MTDLRDRGLLESTLVVWMGEFGRTPKINRNGGRDHFPNAWSVVLGGAGIKGGQVDRQDRARTAMEVDGPAGRAWPTCMPRSARPWASIHTKENISPEGRPIALVDRDGKPIAELVG